jgi:uncharacterized membrane protein
MTTMADVGGKFGDWIKEGFDLYKQNLSVLILSSLIAYALTVVTLGILGGPMFAGLIKIVLRLHDKEQPPPTVGDVFQGFHYFLPSFLFTLVWGLIFGAGACILGFVPCIGPLIAIALTLAGVAFLMFGFYLIVDQGMDFWPASMASIEKVKPDFFPFLGLYLVAAIIGELGVLACGIGVFATMPICFAILAVTYRDVFAEGQRPPAPPAREITPPEPPAPEAAGDGSDGPDAPDAPETPDAPPETDEGKE